MEAAFKMGAQPRQIHVQPFSSDEWLPTDTELLRRGLGNSYNSMTMEEVQEYLNQGTMTVWRIMGPAKGIFLARSIARQEGMELRILAIAGKGIIKHGREITSQIRMIAQKAGFKWLTCTVDNRPGRAIHEWVGFEPVSINYKMDL